MRQPPRLARWLVSRCAWPDDRDTVTGDLAEQFQARLEQLGWGRAAIWYWREALALSWGLKTLPAFGRGRTGSVVAFDDVRYAWRRLWRRPVTSAVSILTLAIATAAGVAAWTLLQAVLLSPLPVRDIKDLVVVDDRFLQPEFTAIQELGLFADVIAAGTLPGQVVEVPGHTQAFRDVAFVSHDFFDVLGLAPAAGRAFGPEDDARGAPPVALLSYHFWRDVLGASVDAVGSEILINRRTVATVVGIAPRGFRGLSLVESPDLFMPLLAVAQSQTRGWLNVLGRLRPGVSSDQAGVELARLSEDRDFADREMGVIPLSVFAVPARVRPDVSQFIGMLMATVGLLLLVGAMTVGMLLLMRTDERRDELAMCMALGARRSRLGWGIAVEGALMATAGAVVALPITSGMLAAVRAFDLPGRISIAQLEVGVDAGAAGTAVLTAFAATVVIGLVAAVVGSSVKIGDGLKSRANSTPDLRRRTLQTSLAVGQVAIAIVLLAGCGLFLRSLMAALDLNPGLNASRLSTGLVSVIPAGYSLDRVSGFFDELTQAVRQHPSVQAVGSSGFTGNVPLGGVVQVDGEPRQFPSPIELLAVDEGYFSTIELPILRGRNFGPEDRNGAPRVAVVSRSLARALDNEEGALDKVLQAGSQDEFEIVGVVPDVVTRVGRLEPLVIYRPFAQVRGGLSRSVVMRSDEPGLAGQAAVAALRRLEPRVLPPVFMTIQDGLRDQLRPAVFGARVLGVLGSIALLLTLMSVYVSVSSIAVQRRRELGIRAALGASPRQLCRLVFTGTVRLAVLGVAAGWLLVWQGARLVRGLFFGVESFDPATLVTISAGIVLLILVVGLKPALAATRIDLARRLRED